MADDIDTVQPDSGQAGGESDRQDSGRGLAAAISSAFEDLGIEDEGAPSAKTPVKKAKEEPSTETATTEPTTEDIGKQAEETAPAAAPKHTAPAQWSAAHKAQFDQLPDTAKAILLDLAKFQEADYTRKSQGAAADRRFAQSVRGLITDEHREQLQRHGLDEVGGFKRLLEYQDYALRQPKNYVRWFAQAANLRPIDIWPELAGGRQPQPQPQPGNGQRPPQPGNGAAPVDPQIAQLRGTVEHLSRWVNDRQRQDERQQREMTANVEKQAKGVIDRFREQKDDKGEVLYPHFAKVEDLMTSILVSNPSFNEIEDPTERLKAAYEAACAWDPDIRRQQTELEAARLSAAGRRKEDVEKAQRAKPPVPSNSPNTADTRGGGKVSLKDRVSQAMEESGVT